MVTVAHRPCKRLSRGQLRVFRHQQAQKARNARRDLYRYHQQLPKQARAFFDPLSPAFTRLTYHRFALLAVAAILTLDGHTICNLLCYLGVRLPNTSLVTTGFSPGALGTAGTWHGGSLKWSSSDSCPVKARNWGCRF